MQVSCWESVLNKKPDPACWCKLASSIWVLWIWFVLLWFQTAYLTAWQWVEWGEDVERETDGLAKCGDSRRRNIHDLDHTTCNTRLSDTLKFLWHKITEKASFWHPRLQANQVLKCSRCRKRVRCKKSGSRRSLRCVKFSLEIEFFNVTSARLVKWILDVWWIKQVDNKGRSQEFFQSDQLHWIQTPNKDSLPHTTMVMLVG